MTIKGAHRAENTPKQKAVLKLGGRLRYLQYMNSQVPEGLFTSEERDQITKLFHIGREKAQKDYETEFRKADSTQAGNWTSPECREYKGK